MEFCILYGYISDTFSEKASNEFASFAGSWPFCFLGAFT